MKRSVFKVATLVIPMVVPAFFALSGCFDGHDRDDDRHGMELRDDRHDDHHDDRHDDHNDSDHH